MTDACDPSVNVSTLGAGVVSCISSDEAVNGNGDGNTTPDIKCVDATKVQLRAERAGGSDGRVYKIHYSFTDLSGNTTPGTCRIDTRHNQGQQPSVDSGATYCVKCPGDIVVPCNSCP